MAGGPSVHGHIGDISLVCIACLPLFFLEGGEEGGGADGTQVQDVSGCPGVSALAFSDCFTAREVFVALHAPLGARVTQHRR